MLALAVLTLLVVLAVAVDTAVGNRSLLRLADLPAWNGPGAPRLSVLVAARDEARGVEAGVGSLLALSYPGLEVVVVDDRSTDGTGAILDRMAAADPRLRVVHVAALPDGWLGKNHALDVAASRARGEWLLFTDADVVIEPTAASRAVRHAAARSLDHLTVLPEVLVPGVWLGAFVGAFALLFVGSTRPWKARDPRSGRFIGIGAFNLVRADVYRKVGGHRAIAMRPDDDIKLGKLVKTRGFRQEAAIGLGMVTVEWYASVREMVRGLMKNAFAGLEYSLPRVVASLAAILLLHVWPFVAPLAADGWTAALYAAAALALVAVCADNARNVGVPAWTALLFPVGALFLAFVIARSTWLALASGGISWRDTHYPLAALKANRV